MKETTGRAFKLSPVDSWFFRDGRPYNKGESNQTDVKSIFPPFAPTVVGALRAAFARNMGWNGEGDWNMEIKEKLGDGQKLASLKFKGPYLVRKEKIREENDDGDKIEREILFPAPLHLLGREPPKGSDEKWSFTRLRPGKVKTSDMGKVRLPESGKGNGDRGEDEEKRMKPLSKYYLTRSDLGKVLNDENLDSAGIEPVKIDDLWKLEFNVGIVRNEETLTTEEGALFSRQFVRPGKGVSILVEVEGIGGDVKPETAVTFGGESRMAYVEEMDSSLRVLPEMPELKPDPHGNVKFTTTFLTPADLSPGDLGSGKDIPGLPGVKLVSACIAKPVRIGGWDSGRRGPLPLKPFIPAGSTLFCETTDRSNVPENGSHIGKKTEFGYGQIAIGIWNDIENKED